MTKFMRLPILTIFVFTIFNVFAAERCNDFFQKLTSGSYGKTKIKFADNVKVGNKKLKTYVNSMVKKHTGKTFEGETFDEAIEAVYKHIKSEPGLSFKQRSTKMSEFAKDLNPGLENMIKKFPPKGTVDAPDLAAWVLRKEAIEEVKSIKFQMVKKVQDFERFKASEYIEVAKDEFLPTKISASVKHMQLDEYEKYTESWIYHNMDGSHAKGKLFRDIDPGDAGVISVNDIRDIEAYNLWPMYLKEHDMRHIHYGYSHPMALTTMMESAQSKQPLRFVMIGSLYEGVDRVQYSHETAINKFFGQQIASKEVFGIERNMDLEEAMITLALSSEDDLWKVADAIGHRSSIEGWVEQTKNWKPKKVPGTKYNGKALNGKTFKKDIQDMYTKYMKKANEADVWRRKLLDDPELNLTQKQEIRMKMQNYQLDPEDPEIVIDGVRFKNDGRAHYGGSDSESVIGIGDQ